MSLLIEVYFDGLCQPVNPCGIACYAFVVKSDGKTIHSDYGLAAEPFSKDATNNVAEYMALVKALKWLLANNLNTGKVEIKSDSQLVVKQLSGEYKVKAKRIISLYRQVLLLKNKFKEVEIVWVPREENKEADRLTNKAYNRVLQDNPEYVGRGVAS
ncbi:MAG TPA: ribonuclease HI [Nitrososphaera sp.]|jgi:ribonuclease HI|nr:ribonuclease HI [Nitrososphaera sp.]